MKKIELGTEDIFREIIQLNFPQGHYVIVGGAVLAAHGIRITHDIDIVGTPELLEKLKQTGEWTIKNRPRGEPGLAKGIMEVYPDVNCLEHQPTYEDLFERANIIQGIPFAALGDILLFKKGYGRKKDLDDIKRIEAHQRDNKLNNQKI